MPWLQRLVALLSQLGVLLPFAVINDCSSTNRQVISGLEAYQRHDGILLPFLILQGLVALFILLRPGGRSRLDDAGEASPAARTAWSFGLRALVCAVVAGPIAAVSLIEAVMNWSEVWSGTLLHVGGWAGLTGLLVLAATPAALACAYRGPRDRLLLWGYFGGLLVCLACINGLMMLDDLGGAAGGVFVLMYALPLAPTILAHGALPAHSGRRALLGGALLLWWGVALALLASAQLGLDGLLIW